MSSTAMEWNCEKWADCSCPARRPCECGMRCTQGTVTIDQVKQAMESQCPMVDCSCKNECKCGKGKCTGGGTTERNAKQWVEYVAAQDAS